MYPPTAYVISKDNRLCVGVPNMHPSTQQPLNPQFPVTAYVEPNPGYKCLSIVNMNPQTNQPYNPQYPATAFVDPSTFQPIVAGQFPGGTGQFPGGQPGIGQPATANAPVKNLQNGVSLNPALPATAMIDPTTRTLAGTVNPANPNQVSGLPAATFPTINPKTGIAIQQGQYVNPNTGDPVDASQAQQMFNPVDGQPLAPGTFVDKNTGVVSGAVQQPQAQAQPAPAPAPANPQTNPFVGTQAATNNAVSILGSCVGLTIAALSVVLVM